MGTVDDLFAAAKNNACDVRNCIETQDIDKKLSEILKLLNKNE